MLVDILFYLFELNLLLVDTEEVLGLVLQSKSLALVLASVLASTTKSLALEAKSLVLALLFLALTPTLYITT